MKVLPTESNNARVVDLSFDECGIVKVSKFEGISNNHRSNNIRTTYTLLPTSMATPPLVDLES